MTSGFAREGTNLQRVWVPIERATTLQGVADQVSRLSRSKARHLPLLPFRGGVVERSATVERKRGVAFRSRTPRPPSSAGRPAIPAARPALRYPGTTNKPPWASLRLPRYGPISPSTSDPRWRSLPQEDALMPMTPEQIDLATKLRAGGMSYEKIARQLGIASDATVWKFFNPRPPKPKPPPPQEPKRPPAALLLPPQLYHGSIPIQRHVTFIERNSPQLSKPELQRDLALAVRNTARL
jgi:hypothetical protein